MKKLIVPKLKTLPNARQMLFVQHYLANGKNAFAAALSAGYSKAHPRAVGYALLRNITVINEIERRTKAISDKLELAAEDIVKELMKIGFSNMDDYTSKLGESITIDLSKVTRDQLAAVSEISEETAGRNGKGVRLKLYDKISALTLLGKHMGVFVDRSEVTYKGVSVIVASKMDGDIIAEQKKIEE